MNARDIIKLAAKLYIDDYLKKKTTILAKTNKECFPTTIEEYDMYIKMLCENCLTEILNKKITAIKPKKIE